MTDLETRIRTALEAVDEHLITANTVKGAIPQSDHRRAAGRLALELLSDPAVRARLLGEERRWQPIAEAPTDRTQFIAACPDGRRMIWSGQVWAQTRPTDKHTPEHLRYPATHFMLLSDLPPLPAPPQSEEG